MKTNVQELKSFLFTTWEGGGNVAPALTVARKLREAGHVVRVLADESIRDEARRHGIEFRSWTSAPNRPDRSPESCPVRDWEAASPPEGIQRLLDKIMTGPALAYALDLLAELDREPADLVVTSEMLLGVMAGCEARGQAFAIFAANLCFYPIPGMPAFGPGLPPPRREEEASLHAQIIEGTTQMLDGGLDRLNAARCALGLAPLAHLRDQLLPARRFLLGTSRRFDFAPPSLPESIAYVGPQLDEPGWSGAWTRPWGEGAAEPLVAVAFSTTFQNHAQSLQAVLAAIGSLPVRGLVTRGPIEALSLQPAANTVCVERAPHNAVMREAAVVVTHGGHGTVMRALLHQRPLLILPHGRDQGENAVRVVERGAGLSLPAQAGRDEIARALRRLLEEPQFAEAAAALGASIRAGRDDDDVVSLLEAMVTAVPNGARLAS